mmetsp:Transcript_35165/g.90359  ORF Transcript_35165/g.90359 Transcript_35165/m.90359 type:complete len:413 (-) Transcript_35165:340-1578(-)
MTARGQPRGDNDGSMTARGQPRSDNDGSMTARGQPRLPAMGLLNLAGRSEPTCEPVTEEPRCTDRSGGDREEAPAMLNLEEINMSEEELINSYDPENEENNYHLPNHILKRLQLGRFRTACSEAVENSVFISGYMVPSNLEILQTHGITHIVNMAADVCDNCFPDKFEYCTYYLKDANSEDLTPLFYRTLEWIQNVVDGGGRVLVHCREGVSRSATMVIAYLMWSLHLPFEAAHERLRKVRPICNPNTGFTCQLLMLGKRFGVSGAGNRPALPSDKASFFRVAPHHPKEPFLLLVPGESPQTGQMFDPRFGWVAQRGTELVLWLGAQVPDQDAVHDAVKNHARWAHVFEKRQCDITVVHQGAEPPAFWQLLGMQAALADARGTAAPRPAFDADFEILKDCAAAKRAVESVTI